MMNDEEEFSWTAQKDQNKMGARDMAEICASFYHGLIDSDVPEEAATEIAGSWVAASFYGTGFPRETHDE